MTEQEDNKKIYTMDDPEWSKIPRSEYKMSKEMMNHNDRMYPSLYNPYFDSEEYYQFITPQAYHAFEEWMD